LGDDFFQITDATASSFLFYSDDMGKKEKVYHSVYIDDDGHTHVGDTQENQDRFYYSGPPLGLPPVSGAAVYLHVP
jgi:hypothetical protein